MICQTCVSENKKSTIQEGYTTSTCAGGGFFYDENGKKHYHDPNTHTTRYCCSNGHKWSEKVEGSCWCGWKR